MLRHEDNLVSRLSGNTLQPLAGISVTVTDNVTGLPASLYSDNGVTPLLQPLVTDNDGYYGFYAPDGSYTMSFTGVRIAPFTRQLVLDDPKDNPYATKAELAAGSGASIITFTQAGAGAVPRDLQAKGREFVSVKDYGAVGDGAADDTAAIQAAINACILAKHKLFIPSGTYNVSKTLGYGSQYCLKINGPICIEGESQSATIIRTIKIGGALPDGSGAGYAGAIGIVTGMATPEISISRLTIDGGNSSTDRTANPFNPLHKGIFSDLNSSPVQNFRVEFVTVKNLEGEGIYAPNYQITTTVIANCRFDTIGGSMGNVAGNTTYLNNRFTNGTNNGIEMSLDQNTGALVVDGNSFYNASQSGGTSIVSQGPSTTDASKRTGTKMIVRNNSFEYTQAWLTSTAASAYRVSPVSFTGIGTVIVHNNVFTNATVGDAYGHGLLLVRDFNDNVDMSNNVIKVNDPFFKCAISTGNMGGTKSLQLRDNTTLAEYPLTTSQDLYQSGGSIPCEKFTARGNCIQLRTAIPFVTTLTAVDFVILPPYRTYTFKLVLNIVNAVSSVIDFALGSTQIASMVNEVLPAGHYARYATVTVPATASYNLLQQYRIRCSGDAANSFSVSLVDA